MSLDPNCGIPMPIADDRQKLQRALSLHQQGNLADAAKIYREITKRNPNNVYAIHYLGVIEAAAGNIEQAKRLMARSLSVTPPNVMFIENYATLLCQMGDFESALQICEQGLKINNTSAPLLFNGAIALFKLNKLQESLLQFDKVLSFHKNHLAALNERGAVLAAMKQHDAALESFDKALDLNPEFADALINKGTVYWQIERYDDAAAAYNKALSFRPEAAIAWLGCASVASALKRYDEALAAYDKAIGLAPNLAEAWLGRGNVYFAYKSYDEASVAYEKALALRADLADAWLGRANVLFAVRQYDEALFAYEKVIEKAPDRGDAWFGRGNVLSGLKRFDEAFSAYDKARLLKPGLAGLESARLRTKMQRCAWSDFDAECERLLSSFRSGALTAYPFELLTIPSSSEEQLHCATRWIAKDYPASGTPAWQGERYNHDRIQVAYVSADFCPHPVSFLTAGMFENHDRSRFAITGISLGPEERSEIRQRVEASFDRFIDASMLSDNQIAELIKNLQIDILVDLNGFTGGGRTGIFAKRPAPIQVNYLGYPGTLGAEYIDYLIADRIVIPEDRRQCYSEKVVYLPNSYLVNDASLPIADTANARSDCGLPTEGVVFCCFNNNYKITPPVFESWMRIIKSVEGSVLWLAEVSPEAAHNLRNEATARGVDPERVIFAERLPRLPDHLARLRFADLFLDTLPYNAHATACHALWAGVPVLTCLGETFAGRVAASLLHAIHLPELITTSREAYEALAIDLGVNGSKIEEIKRKLSANRLTTPLFDTKLFTRHIEAAYTAMYERYLAELGPDHLYVSHA